MQIKLTKAKQEIYVHSDKADSTAVLKILYAQLLVKRVRTKPAYLLAHNTVLQAEEFARYNMTRVELKNVPQAKCSSRSL